MIHVHHLALSFGKTNVFSELSFSLEQGEIACLLGQSGSGKTTALRCIAGFERPQMGKITMAGKTLVDDSTNLPAHERNIGMVFQDYALFPHLTIAQNIGFGISHLPKAEQKQRVDELLTLVGLPNYHKRYIHELSGGQQQRVAIARALACKPKLILLDEPFSNLDNELRTRLSHEIRTLLKNQNVSAIMVTHDQHEAFMFADKIGLLHGGKLHQWATPEDLYRTPASLEVAQFIGDGVLLPATIQDGKLDTAFGSFDCQHTNATCVLIRPENVKITDDTPIATITDRQFLGSHYRYQIGLNGESVFAYAPLRQHYEIGQMVGIEIFDGWAV
ncbi:ABC transporter ATP-binding protein [Moraxella nasovis]|uniref:ABC transporter ATP-binding protein n=1 Tax=Moraxella nasovis TaxID=2904121 RepID=UPI001F60E39F|nr:ABC transporter ATP-binding protein [Moraxella nasovis]UNU73094.1 ABC transporter ATP-binding protein [Moraxella nasovis]